MRDVLDRHARARQQRHETVPQLSRCPARALQASPRHNAAEGPAHVRCVERSSRARAKHQPPVDPRRAGPHPRLDLVLAVTSQHCNASLRKLQRSPRPSRLRVSATPDRTPHLHRRRITVKMQVLPGQCTQLLRPGSREQRHHDVRIHRRPLGRFRGCRRRSSATAAPADAIDRPTRQPSPPNTGPPTDAPSTVPPRTARPRRPSSPRTTQPAPFRPPRSATNTPQKRSTAQDRRIRPTPSRITWRGTVAHHPAQDKRRPVALLIRLYNHQGGPPRSPKLRSVSSLWAEQRTGPAWTLDISRTALTAAENETGGLRGPSRILPVDYLDIDAGAVVGTVVVRPKAVLAAFITDIRIGPCQCTEFIDLPLNLLGEIAHALGIVCADSSTRSGDVWIVVRANALVLRPVAHKPLPVGALYHHPVSERNRASLRQVQGRPTSSSRIELAARAIR